MANVKLSELNDIASLTDDDLFYVVDGTTLISRKTDIARLNTSIITPAITSALTGVIENVTLTGSILTLVKKNANNTTLTLPSIRINGFSLAGGVLTASYTGITSSINIDLNPLIGNNLEAVRDNVTLTANTKITITQGAGNISTGANFVKVGDDANIIAVIDSNISGNTRLTIKAGFDFFAEGYTTLRVKRTSNVHFSSFTLTKESPTSYRTVFHFGATNEYEFDFVNADGEGYFERGVTKIALNSKFDVSGATGLPSGTGTAYDPNNYEALDTHNPTRKLIGIASEEVPSEIEGDEPTKQSVSYEIADSSKHERFPTHDENKPFNFVVSEKTPAVVYDSISLQLGGTSPLSAYGSSDSAINTLISGSITETIPNFTFPAVQIDSSEHPNIRIKFADTYNAFWTQAKAQAVRSLKIIRKRDGAILTASLGANQIGDVYSNTASSIYVNFTRLTSSLNGSNFISELVVITFYTSTDATGDAVSLAETIPESRRLADASEDSTSDFSKVIANTFTLAESNWNASGRTYEGLQRIELGGYPPNSVTEWSDFYGEPQNYLRTGGSNHSTQLGYNILSLIKGCDFARAYGTGAQVLFIKTQQINENGNLQSVTHCGISSRALQNRSDRAKVTEVLIYTDTGVEDWHLEGGQYFNRTSHSAFLKDGDSNLPRRTNKSLNVREVERAYQGHLQLYNLYIEKSIEESHRTGNPSSNIRNSFYQYLDISPQGQQNAKAPIHEGDAHSLSVTDLNPSPIPVRVSTGQRSSSNNNGTFRGFSTVTFNYFNQTFGTLDLTAGTEDGGTSTNANSKILCIAQNEDGRLIIMMSTVNWRYPHVLKMNGELYNIQSGLTVRTSGSNSFITWNSGSTRIYDSLGSSSENVPIELQFDTLDYDNPNATDGEFRFPYIENVTTTRNIFLLKGKGIRINVSGTLIFFDLPTQSSAVRLYRRVFFPDGSMVEQQAHTRAVSGQLLIPLSNLSYTFLPPVDIPYGGSKVEWIARFIILAGGSSYNTTFAKSLKYYISSDGSETVEQLNPLPNIRTVLD